ncbi:MAG: hypothetical protein AB1424_11620 [Thermodesulfobacteriota bacterium]
MSQYDEKARANARRIDFEIETLSLGHWKMFTRQYKSFWAHAKKISDMFRTLKPLNNDDRQKLWEKFSSVCNEVKAKQASEQENREFKSKQHRNDIISEAEGARVCTLFGFAPPDVQEMKSLGRTLRNASSLLSKHKEEMFGEHKQECFKLIQEIRHIHDLWWEELKQQRSKRQEDFQQRVRANLEKNYERHRKATDALRRVRNHADDLRGQISSAWNDDFRDRAYGWLSETEDKIRDIEESIRQIEDWISEDEEKLR